MTKLYAIVCPHTSRKNVCKYGRREDNHKNSRKQLIYAMDKKSKGKSRSK
jgi:hypothetical protein